MIDLGVVILSYGDGPAGRLATVLVEGGCPATSIVVMHNDAPDGLRPSLPQGVEMFPTGGNLGYGAAMALGQGEFRSRAKTHIALLTHDVGVAYPDLVRLAAGIPSTGGHAIGPRIVNAEGQTLSGGGALGPAGRVRHLPPAEGPTSVDWIDGAAIVTSVDAPDVPGEYFMYYEDVAFGWLVRQGGGAVLADPNVIATTTPSAGSRRAYFRYMHWRNRVAFCRKYLGRRASMRVTAELLVAMPWRAFEEARSTQSITSGVRTMRVFVTALVDGRRLRLGPPPDWLSP